MTEEEIKDAIKAKRETIKGIRQEITVRQEFINQINADIAYLAEQLPAPFKVGDTIQWTDKRGYPVKHSQKTVRITKLNKDDDGRITGGRAVRILKDGSDGANIRLWLFDLDRANVVEAQP